MTEAVDCDRARLIEELDRLHTLTRDGRFARARSALAVAGQGGGRWMTGRRSPMRAACCYWDWCAH